MIELIVKGDYLICQLKVWLRDLLTIETFFIWEWILKINKTLLFFYREKVFLSERFFFTGQGKPAPMSMPLPFWVRPLSGHILSPKDVRFETQRPWFSPNIPYLSYLNGFWTWVAISPKPFFTFYLNCNKQLSDSSFAALFVSIQTEFISFTLYFSCNN